MYRRKADANSTIDRAVQLDPLIDIIKNGQTNSLIALHILDDPGNVGWGEVTEDLSEDFNDFFPTSLGSIDGADVDVYATAWSVFINYVSGKLYPSFLELHADTENEANALADGFMAKLYDLLRGKSIVLTFNLRISGGVIR